MRTARLSLACLVIGACASAPPPRGPGETVAAYVRAVRSGDARHLHQLLDERTRARVDEASLAARLRENRDELVRSGADVAEALRRAPIRAHARVDLEDGERVVLVQEDGVWRIEGGVFDAPSLESPEDAVLALRRALLRRDLDGVMRLLTQDRRADVEAEIRDYLEASADSLDLETSTDGDEATVRLTGGRIVRLVREEGEWRISDVDAE